MGFVAKGERVVVRPGSGGTNQSYLFKKLNQDGTFSDISWGTDIEDFDSAISMTKSREAIFLNCKCMQKYLDLTPEQKKKADSIIEEIKNLEKRNIDYLSDNIEKVNQELKKTQKTEKIQMAYEFDEDQKG